MFHPHQSTSAKSGGQEKNPQSAPPHIESEGQGGDNQNRQTYSTHTLANVQIPLPCGAPVTSRPPHVVLVDLDNFTAIVLQKLALAYAAREYGQAATCTEKRFIDLRFGDLKMRIPIRPEADSIPFPPAGLPIGPLSSEVGCKLTFSTAQLKILDLLKDGKSLTYSELKEAVGRNFVDRVKKNGEGNVVRRWGGHTELIQAGMVDKSNGKFRLTEMGEAAAAEFCEQDHVDDPDGDD